MPHTLKEKLAKLAKERNKKSPLKFYEGRSEFEKAQEELAILALKQASSIKEESPDFFDKFSLLRQSPVFICGFFKAGTSMLNSLFDFHPQVVALPPGFGLLGNVRKRALRMKRSGFFEYLSKHSVKMLYNPNGKFPMNLLNQGRIDELNLAPYARFLSYLKTLVFRAKTQSEILSSVALALFLTNKQVERGDKPKYWAEKTIANEKEISLVKKIFPRAKFIYIKRNPKDNLASLSRWYRASGREKIANPYFYFWDMKASQKRAAKLSKRNDFLVIDYENLVKNQREVLGRICSFLDIVYDLSLETPSVLGIPDTPNISDQKDPNRKTAGKIIASRVDNYKGFLTEKQIKDINLFFSSSKHPFIFLKVLFYRFLLFIKTKSYGL